MRLTAQDRGRPNILIVLPDDLGWADLRCYGSKLNETPNIDGLAASGVRFTQAYSAGSVCSPTRASIQTGRYPARVGVTDYLHGDLPPMALKETTIAEVLKQNGYQTFYAGKWHLGGKGFLPEDQGYDVVIPEEPGKGTERAQKYTAGCLKFLGDRDRKRPFFAFVSFNEPHTPITPREPYVQHFRKKIASMPPPPPIEHERKGMVRPRQDNPEYASMVSVLDEQFGRIVRKLEESGDAENTVILFLSDNGGLSVRTEQGPTNNSPLRAGKGWLYEGGIRIPFILRAPGLTKAGTTSDAPVITTDVFPTLLEVAGLPLQPDLHKDGGTIRLLLAGAPARPRTFYWHYPHHHGSTWEGGGAIRKGDWKLIEFFEENTRELYNLADDLPERRDMAASNPGMVKQLAEELASWRKQVGARMPSTRP